MVNFRYHLVSLIAVFLALAVGITLGAGVLQTGIGDSLSGDLATVRAERDEAREETQRLGRIVNDREGALTALGRDASRETLTGRTIGVVVLPGADGADVTAARDAAEAAGASTTTATFTDEWAAVDQSFLQSYSGQLAGYVNVSPGTRPEAIVAAALGRTLAEAREPGSEAAVVAELLASTQIGFVEFAGGEGPAEAILVVGPRVEPEPVEGAAERDEASMVASLGAALPTVALGATTSERSGLVDGVRSGDAAVSTIDSVGTAPATVSVPLALAAVLTGTHGHYGSATGANAPIPPLR